MNKYLPIIICSLFFANCNEKKVVSTIPNTLSKVLKEEDFLKIAFIDSNGKLIFKGYIIIPPPKMEINTFDVKYYFPENVIRVDSSGITKISKSKILDLKYKKGDLMFSKGKNIYGIFQIENSLSHFDFNLGNSLIFLEVRKDNNNEGWNEKECVVLKKE